MSSSLMLRRAASVVEIAGGFVLLAEAVQLGRLLRPVGVGIAVAVVFGAVGIGFVAAGLSLWRGRGWRVTAIWQLLQLPYVSTTVASYHFHSPAAAIVGIGAEGRMRGTWDLGAGLTLSIGGAAVEPWAGVNVIALTVLAAAWWGSQPREGSSPSRAA